jgi:methyltransferase, FkbM family
MLPPTVQRSLVRWRRRLFELAGSERYSRPGLDGLDRKIARHLDFAGGFFVEAGANDGVRQSNTYWLERFRGWRGVLIEPMPELARECRKNRPGATVVEAALVACAEKTDTVEMKFAGLMSTASGAFGTEEATSAHVAAGLRVERLEATYTVKVAARTLTQVLEAAGVRGEIHLLSLDVEGMEEAVLRGLAFERFAPRMICVETRPGSRVGELLASRYEEFEVLTDYGERRDVLFRRRDA